MSDIYSNAVDSFRIGVEHFLKAPGYTSRKHAILTIFHAIELFLKEQLHRTNPILIYKSIDTKINDDSLTVGIREALVRLENLGQGLPPEPRAIIERIQKKRNRIEHHRYDHQAEDEEIISESLQFIFFFVDGVLKKKLERDVPPEMLRQIQGLIYDRQDLYWIAGHRLDQWLADTWPNWNDEESDMPGDFEGTIDCPICHQTYLVVDHHTTPFCFYCNTSVDAQQCDSCGCTHLSSEKCLRC
ncbi:hypothetical protein M2401_001658 [Pseudomonas sp. JUb42]|uniref:hypothetical protein n=1 Tax=Pseudomonas sp. JUb42 TaxID=2940611 RepID=UPI0021698547|nr:hypothetical protein [Pseudomonas sp. JUb42]MCS3467933.1 hypothetical protein [Pseudomonas sp. JUb42]